MLSITKLNKSFRKKHILKNISISMEPGIYGLLGPNGAGKTTLMRSILGIYSVKGSIEFDDKEVNEKIIRQYFGYLPQKFGTLKTFSVYEALEYIGSLKNIKSSDLKEQIPQVLEKVNLLDEKKTKVKALSGGMLRRLGIAQMLLGNPRVLIFDEPTAGLDPEERIRFKNIIRRLEKDKIVIISTHIVDDVDALCDKIIVMDKGQILFADTANALKNVADGKIFEIDEKDFDETKDMILVSINERSGKKYCRVYSKNELYGKVLDTTIEDGYICTLKI